MTGLRRAASVALLSSALAAILASCDGETAGQKLDRALDKTGDKVIEAGEAIKPR